MSGPGTCPTCGKALDPLRAPAVKVIAGRITAFCSPVCAGRAATEPALSVMPTMVPAKESIQIDAIPPENTEAARTVAAAAAAKRAAQATVKKKPQAQIIAEHEDGDDAEHEDKDDDGDRADDRAAHAAAASAAQPVRSPVSGPIRVRRITTGDDDLVDEPLHPPYDAPYDEPDDDHGDHGDHADGDAAARDARAPRRRTGSRRGKVLLLTAALVAGGGAVAVLSTLVSPSHPHQAAARNDAPPAPAPKTQPARPAHADPAEVYDHARTTLGQLLGSSSERVRRVAALALARVGDKAALDALAHALETEPSAIARIQAAFALARAGDKRGKDALVAALASPRHDVRGDAATDLILLADAKAQKDDKDTKAGIALLDDMMGTDQLRVSAAETLARVGDAKAIAALRAVLADAKASKENKNRALRALAAAGQADVADALRASLTDKDVPRSLTAQALARLGDPAAAAQLTDDLDVESLRVDAAIALRRLDARAASPPDASVAAVRADHLAPALAAGRDTDQASAAEAAVILFAPAQPTLLAEHE